jgi:hypothetical protein
MKRIISSHFALDEDVVTPLCRSGDFL